MQIKDFYNGKKVFITGITGFKGSWLCPWLKELGAIIQGYALMPRTKPNHYEFTNLKYNHTIGDIREYSKLESAIACFSPDIIFHLAAQPYVYAGYDYPKYTIETNVIGTTNLLESARILNNIPAIIIITTDKVFDTHNTPPYKEDAPLGGYDPYSASKSCTELLVNCYRDSFFPLEKFNQSQGHGTLLTSVRAGNVVGGGDWGNYRLIPDIVRALYEGKKLIIRNPSHVRPWLYILDVLYGYLCIGKKLYTGTAIDTLNFGTNEICSVQNVINLFPSTLDMKKNIIYNKSQFHETEILQLDSCKAKQCLNWSPKYNFIEMLNKTQDWYHNFYHNNKILTTDQINEYMELIGEKAN